MGSPGNPVPGTFPPVPYPTIDDLLTIGRNLLLDSQIGPRVPNPSQTNGTGLLADVRVRGKPSPVGTVNWQPGSTGYPFGILTTGQVTKSYRETRRSWSDWQASLQIALTANINGAVDFEGWANLWEAVLDQWFPLHRGFGIVADPPGDHWWQYQPLAQKRVFNTGSGIAVYGLIVDLKIHNVTPITWGV